MSETLPGSPLYKSETKYHQSDLEEILNEITELLLDVNKVQEKLQHIFRYTDRVTGELKKPKRVRPDSITRSFIAATKQRKLEKETQKFMEDAGTQFNENIKKIVKDYHDDRNKKST